MNDSVNTAKWIGKWLLQVPAYLVANYVVRTLIVVIFRLLVRAGATITHNPLVLYPLGFSFVSGILAGIVAILAFRLFMMLPQMPAIVEVAPWKKAQAWTWTFAAAWFFYGAMRWWTSRTTHSVLAASGSGPKISDLFTVFFGSACDMIHGNYGGCLPQLGYTSPLLGCIGYSLAVFIPMGWLKKRNSAAQSGDASDQA